MPITVFAEVLAARSVHPTRDTGVTRGLEGRPGMGGREFGNGADAPDPGKQGYAGPPTEAFPRRGPARPAADRVPRGQRGADECNPGSCAWQRETGGSTSPYWRRACKDGLAGQQGVEQVCADLPVIPVPDRSKAEVTLQGARYGLHFRDLQGLLRDLLQPPVGAAGAQQIRACADLAMGGPGDEADRPHVGPWGLLAGAGSRST